MDALLTIPKYHLFCRKYEDIHHQQALFVEVKKSSKPHKINDFGLDIIGSQIDCICKFRYKSGSLTKGKAMNTS